ncbi:MAG TPA: endonuclease/exonuclease/phosphatase family protein [Polyangiaceae bacterium]|nr:endonuclease/exonuclease/phosphatase family protein [Polyangiaceae bacterium]
MGLAQSTAPARARKWLRWTCAALAVLYPVCLLGTALALRLVGERWWVTGTALYLPRAAFAAPLPLIALSLAALRLYRLLWTQLVSALVVLFPLMGFALPGRAQRPRDAPTLRVLSYNINSSRGGVDQVVEEIDRYSPDVAILEEIGSRDRIESALASRYSTVFASGQFLVGARFPIVSSHDPERVLLNGQSRGPRFVQFVIETPLGRIAIYAVHPISPREGLQSLRGARGLRREILSGRLFTGADADHFRRDSALRALQVQEFAEAAAQEPGPAVIAGDTNLPGLSYVLSRYLSAFQDGFARVGSGFGYTFPTDNGRQPWMRIDRIFANDELSFVHFEVGRSLASDHLCVIADLQATERKAHGRE